MKYISKLNITFALKSGVVKFQKGKEIDEADALDFKKRTTADTYKKYIVEEIAEKKIEPKIEAETKPKTTRRKRKK